MMNAIYCDKKRILSRWVGWFFTANTVLYLLAGLSYLTVLPNFFSAIGVSIRTILIAWGFLLLAFVGQFALFAFSVGFIVWLVTCFYPKRSVVMSLAVLLASIMALLIISDSIAYHLFHFHLAGIVWKMLMSGQLFSIVVLTPIEWLWLSLLILLVLAIESVLAVWIWRCVVRHNKGKGYGYTVLTAIVLSLLLSYSLMWSVINHKVKNWGQAENIQLFVLSARIVPYFNNVLAMLLPGQQSMRSIQLKGSGLFFQQPKIKPPLHYPLHPLVFKTPKKHLNIVFILIDTWRFDMINKTVTPNIAAFAKKSWRFTNHWSGGNATGPGVFSLFYSLPYHYWSAMLQHRRQPVFMQQLLKDHYQMGIFASGTLAFPALDKTVFSGIHPLQVNTPGDNSVQRDQRITQEFQDFIGRINTQKPFFSFLFYDAVHNYCGAGQNKIRIFKPSISMCDRFTISEKTNIVPYINRYKNAVYFDDQLVGKVLESIRKKGLLKNTVVVVTADHGSEFNDEHMGYWGHTTAYDPYQLKVPFIVYWPGKKPEVFFYKTTHYDLIPTLMKKVLGCVNPAADYSVGRSLFKPGGRHYFIASSYLDYAVVQPHRITRIYPDGGYVITKANEHPMPGAALNMRLFAKVYHQINRFFK